MKPQSICMSYRLCLDKQSANGYNRSLNMAMLASLSFGQKDEFLQKGGRIFHIEAETNCVQNAKSGIRLRRNSYVKSLDVTGSSQQETSGGNLGSPLQDSGVTLASVISASAGDDLWDEEDENDDLHSFKGLVLDLTYRPINVVSWKRALCLEILDKAEVLEYYDQAVCSPSRVFFIPAVLRMSNFLHRPKIRKVKLNLTRYNIFLRDKFKCQYCHSSGNLTVDHITPISRGGGWTWDNLVTACSDCNLKKGDKTLDELQMKLKRPATEPRELDSRDLPPNYRTFRTLICRKSVPPEWVDYMPKRSPII
ncbi:hypothetical protein O6H91_15G034000 [Diphasiastrum complanatum]|uniref:Uncharacterized protein n=3 Tax=Diphasiastrum complanatum TaxID=34168 RepID=A0ACC2BI13_DIPCM|nr:hypothetical protein O6H91_15G034000 [Diphasiastrum complanatum]KAJ7529103.1 hypothetical protein O6H91_15G034000 [Diphasiastrum complanatum]KAJ7529104.1 hypothetical protein O6H91_15G034000 [Diphasiastrum complanatum]